MGEIDTIATGISDTLQYKVDAMTDSLVEAAKSLTITVPDSPLAPVDSSLFHLQPTNWPVTLWGDTLVRPTSLYNELYFHGKPFAYSLMRDDWVTGILMLSFLMLLVIIAWGRKYLKPQARDFFMPSNNTSNAAPAIKTTAEVYTPVFLTCVASIYCGLLVYALAAANYDLQAGLIPSYIVLGVCIGSFFAYYILRWILYRFVNWIFFQHSKRLTWNAGFSFLSTIESVLFFPIILIALNTYWDFKTTIIVVLSTFGFIRFGLLCHSFRTFFPKIYGLLHLFAYLCTLEMIPLLTIWKVLAVLSSFLIVK